MKRWIRGWLERICMRPALQERILQVVNTGGEVSEDYLLYRIGGNWLLLGFNIEELVRSGKIKRTKYCKTVYYSKVN